MIVMYSARSHLGRVRENNEDNLYVNGIVLPPDMEERTFSIDGSTNSPAIFALCDGMGGEEDGEIASRMAVETLLGVSGRIQSTGPEQLNEEIQAYVNQVNEKIRPSGAAYTEKRMGTTLALAMVTEKGIHCFNIGDSRIYCLQRDLFRQVTNDHTLAAEQIRNGLTASGQAIEGKDAHKLTRCIGIGNIFAVESYPVICGSCRVLICSDGLTDMVSPVDLENVMWASPRATEAASVLLDLALGNGGRDNVTIIVMDIKDSKRSFFRTLANKMKDWSSV